MPAATMAKAKEVLNPEDYRNYRNVRAVAVLFIVLGSILVLGGLGAAFGEQPAHQEPVPPAAAVAMAANPVNGDSVAGTAGTDVSLPKTDSQVTVAGRGPFKSLQVTVNQTQHLLNQAISINWSGAAPTVQNGGKTFFENYLQFMQCWGDDDGTNPDNPGPPPEKCEAGASTAQGAIAGAHCHVTGGNGHYSLVVSAPAFKGLSMLASQRLVYAAIAHLMKGAAPPIHAVDSLQTRVAD